MTFTNFESFKLSQETFLAITSDQRNCCQLKADTCDIWLAPCWAWGPVNSSYSDKIQKAPVPKHQNTKKLRLKKTAKELLALTSEQFISEPGTLQQFSDSWSSEYSLDCLREKISHTGKNKTKLCRMKYKNLWVPAVVKETLQFNIRTQETLHNTASKFKSMHKFLNSTTGNTMENTAGHRVRPSKGIFAYRKLTLKWYEDYLICC